MEDHVEDRADRTRILVVDDESGARHALAMLLEDEGFEVQTAADGFKALGVLDQWSCDLLLTDVRMPVMSGIELLGKARERNPNLVCVVMTAFGTVEQAVEAMQLGAEDYLMKPLNFDAVLMVLERATERIAVRRELEQWRSGHRARRAPTELWGTSPAMQELNALIQQVAPTRATVLVTGESGTGKELVARSLHEHSERSEAPFVALHCAALSESVLESELFGHEKGAFTGASSRRIGKFERAHKGTLFLDEIGEISASTQVKLLRFLQEREFERVGGNTRVHVDVRVIAATHRDLLQEVRKGNFREDLYYRLHVLSLKTPSLRVRRTDIPLLARRFMAKFAQENHKDVHAYAPGVLDCLCAYDWPGNVRELENVIERAVVLTRTHEIEMSHLPSALRACGSFGHGEIRIPGSTLEEIERFAILKTHEVTGGSTAETAKMLGLSVRKVQYRLKAYREKEDCDL